MIAKPLDDPNIKDINARRGFKYDADFMENFSELISTYASALRNLETVINGSDETGTYGICNCSFKMRYFEPSDISNYISYLNKLCCSNMSDGRELFRTVDDLEKFSVAVAKRIMEERHCPAFEDSSIYSARKYSGRGADTLENIVLLSANDVFETCVYSRFELNDRKKACNEHLITFNNLHFTAAMKNVVNGLPDIINKCSYATWDQQMRDVFKYFVQKFILFMVNINTITIDQITSYCVPRSSYTIEKNKDGEAVTECCYLKTNDVYVHEKLPFNCNLRDAVLMDMTRDFKDVQNAIFFVKEDPRSPFSILLKELCTDDCACNPYYDAEMVAKMFIGKVKTKPFTPNGEKHFKANYDDVDFHTCLSWMGKIAHGCNYYDHNYRSDALGNNKFDPIEQTIATIYSMYGGLELKTNSDLANNIVRVFGIMNALIKAYGDNNICIKNWDLVRDILAVFGEIATRNMLKLYSNTHLYVYLASDNMSDTMAPGYLYTEYAVYVEADDKATVELQGGNGQGIGMGKIARTKAKISEVIAKFTAWVQNTLSNFGGKFNENHKLEQNWIKKNASTNTAIEKALGDGSFKLLVGNFPGYKIPFKDMSSVDINTIVTQQTNTTEPVDPSVFYPEALRKHLKDVTDQKQTQEIITNFVLYGQPKKPEVDNSQKTNLTGEMFKELRDDVLEAGKAIDTLCKKMSSELKKGADTIRLQTQELEKVQDKNEDVQNKISRNTEIFNAMQAASTNFDVVALNLLRSKFYKNSYELYRQIVILYGQQFGKTNSTGQQSTQSQTTQSQQQSDEQLNGPEGGNQ